VTTLLLITLITSVGFIGGLALDEFLNRSPAGDRTAFD
jgi:hypothetical protein